MSLPTRHTPPVTAPSPLPLPPLPQWNVKPLETRLAEAEKFRGKIPNNTVDKIKWVIRDSAKRHPEEFAEISKSARLRIVDIQRTVAGSFGIGIEDIIGLCREQSVVRPRQIAMYLSKLLTSRSFLEIGRRFGRDHTTVIHSVRKITGLIEVDKGLAEEIAVLKEMLLS